MFEIQDQPDRQFGDAEVIQHLAAFHIRDALNHLGVHDHLGEGDQVRDELSNALALIENFKATLLIESDLPELELDDERVLVALFIQTVSEFVQHFERTADDGVRLLLARIGVGPSGVKVG